MKLALALAAASLAAAEAPIRGFPVSDVAPQRALESRFRAIPDPARARAYVRRIAARPHPAGSPESKAVAEYALGLFREWGYDARLERFDALLPYPVASQVDMASPAAWSATLTEPAVDGGHVAGALPAFNAYAADGDLTAPLVYVNYGLPADYAELARRGISVKGKIVLVRYGRVWRGTKPLIAEQQGAAACLLFSDPNEDGAAQGDAYPNGPWRPLTSFQRGSVLDMPRQVGDPLTPGWASLPGARRLPFDQAPGILKIPVVPLSATDAAHLISRLQGPAVPLEWRGALEGVIYRFGPGPYPVHVRTRFDWATRPLYNVIARLSGAVEPDQWILYGNHHDAWVFGASDPASGAAALLETARALGELARRGFRPRRTLMFALWDGEEFGLIGSTEWVEKHRATLRARAVAYLNSDSNTSGSLQAGGSPLLETFFAEVARDTANGGVRMTPLGAGSDYVAFAHHAGVPSLNAGFGSAAAMGTYHSIHDSLRWFEAFMDRDYAHSRSFAQLMGVAILRLSEARVLPFDFTALERAVRQAGPNPPRAELDALGESARRYEVLLAGLDARPSRWKEWNRLLLASEQTLLDEAGLPGRPWYKHLLYAPAPDTGYTAQWFPDPDPDRAAGAIAALRRHVDRILSAAGQ